MNMAPKHLLWLFFGVFFTSVVLYSPTAIPKISKNSILVTFKRVNYMYGNFSGHVAVKDEDKVFYLKSPVTVSLMESLLGNGTKFSKENYGVRDSVGEADCRKGSATSSNRIIGIFALEDVVDTRLKILEEQFLNITEKSDKCPQDSKDMPFRGELRPRNRLTLHLQYDNHCVSARNDDVTLVTHTDKNRYFMIPKVIEAWPGPIMMVIYITPEELEDTYRHFNDVLVNTHRPNVKFIIAMKNETVYPMNWLVNVGFKYALGKYIFYLEIDLVPSVGIYEDFLSNQMLYLPTNHSAICYPAFETDDAEHVPRTKEELKSAVDKNKSREFPFRYYHSYTATNYSKWWSTNQSYRVHVDECFGWYEPFYIVPKSPELYFPESILYPWGVKAAYVSQLRCLGYNFSVHPWHFVVHRPHALHRLMPQSTNKVSGFETMKKCSKVMWKLFGDFIQGIRQ